MNEGVEKTIEEEIDIEERDRTRKLINKSMEKRERERDRERAGVRLNASPRKEWWPKLSEAVNENGREKVIDGMEEL